MGGRFDSVMWVGHRLVTAARKAASPSTSGRIESCLPYGVRASIHWRVQWRGLPTYRSRASGRSLGPAQAGRRPQVLTFRSYPIQCALRQSDAVTRRGQAIRTESSGATPRARPRRRSRSRLHTKGGMRRLASSAAPPPVRMATRGTPRIDQVKRFYRVRDPRHASPSSGRSWMSHVGASLSVTHAQIHKACVTTARPSRAGTAPDPRAAAAARSCSTAATHGSSRGEARAAA